MTALTRLFSPIKIGNMEVKNRIVMSPMHTDFANPDGTISDKLIDYHEARARGGVGLITLEVTTIGKNLPYQVRTVALWDDKFIPGFRALADAVHAHGAKVIPQISHPGPESLSPFFHKIQTVGPSPVMFHTMQQMCRELSIEEIEDIVVLYGETARRAREAGCDGVELHAAHSYMLVGSFLSALRNRRIDRYGGDIHGRLTFALEVIQSIKQRAGRDFPIVLRISGDEGVQGGRDIRETQYIAPILQEAGTDAFHVSNGSFPQMGWRILAPTGTPLALNVDVAAKVKEVVSVPVMAVGRINDPQLAEEILKRGEADLTVMGRALIADPDLPNKAFEGRFDDIAPCIACGIGCSGRKVGTDLSCVVNPTVGREREMPITPTTQKKRVMIAGGGPAGLEAARVLALRGHDVEIHEKEYRLGGQFNLAAMPPMKQELTKVIKYLSTQVHKAGARIILQSEVTPEVVRETKPDAVIVATGGGPLVPSIPGIDGPRVVSAHDVLAGKVPLPTGKVLVIGGGLVGLETSEFLANAGDNPVIGRTEIIIIEMMKGAGLDMVPEHRMLVMQRLRESGVRISTSTKVKQFLEDGVVVERDGVEDVIRGADHIVLAMGARPVDELSEAIKGTVGEVHVIGDASLPCRALEAIADGARVGRIV